MPTRDSKLFAHVAALVLFMLLLAWAHEAVNPWLRYDRNAVLSGQVWRLWTCHLVHLNLWHGLLNAGGLLLLVVFFRDLLDRFRLFLWFALCGLGTGLAFVFIDTGLGWYVGLSGLVQGLLVMCLLLGWRGHPRLHSLVLAVVAGRLIWEQTPGYDVMYLQAWIHAPVYVNAHLYGALTGALCAALLCYPWRAFSRPTDHQGTP